MEKQSVKINRKVLSREKEISLNVDFVVPDIKPDIVAIIDTNAKTYIYNEDVGNGKIRLDGNVDSKVLYLSDSGETRSLSVMMDFSEVIEDEKITSDLVFFSSAELLSIDSRIVNERKVSVSARVKIFVSFYEASNIELISSLDDFENLQIKEEKCNIKNLVGSSKAKSSIKEVVECDAEDNILDILSVDVKIGNNENKVSYNKVLSKADCEIRIVYQTEDMAVKVKTATYPIMSFIDLENVSEDDKLETRTSLRNMQVFLAQSEKNKINVNLEFETFLQAYEIKEISVIDDIYSLKNVIDFTKKELDAELDSEAIKNTFSIAQDVEVQDLSRIVSTEASISSVTWEKGNGYINYNVEVSLRIVYLLDSRNGLAVRNAKFSTMTKAEVNESSEVSFRISNESYTVNNDKINCNIEITSTINKNSFKTISVLDNIAEKEEIPKSEYSMVIYFVKPKDTIWKIAKEFNVSMQSIIDSNNIENPDKINIGDRLYIVR